jgi:hypothetical protein
MYFVDDVPAATSTSASPGTPHSSHGAGTDSVHPAADAATAKKQERDVVFVISFPIALEARLRCTLALHDLEGAA